MSHSDAGPSLSTKAEAATPSAMPVMNSTMRKGAIANP